MALGKDVRYARIGSMAIGGAIAGAGGSLFAHFIGFIDPTYLLPLQPFLVRAMVILGRSGNHLRALAATFVTPLPYTPTRFLPSPPDTPPLVAPPPPSKSRPPSTL